MQLNTQTLARGIALAVLTLAVAGLLAGASAVTVSSDTVEITDNDSQEIVVDLEILDDPAAQNTTVELYNETGSLVAQPTPSNPTDGNWTTETFQVTTDGNYTVNVTADTDTAVGQVNVSIEDISEDSALLPSLSAPQGEGSYLLIGVVAAVAVFAIVSGRRVRG